MENISTIHPQYITNNEGKPEFAILPVAEFHALIDEIEDNDDVRAYDEAKANDNGERMLFCDYVIQRKNG